MASERMTQRLVTMVKPSELARIKKSARLVKLNTSDYVRQSVLGQLPPAFDLLADELVASVARTNTALDAAFKAIAESEARLTALDPREPVAK